MRRDLTRQTTSITSERAQFLGKALVKILGFLHERYQHPSDDRVVEKYINIKNLDFLVLAGQHIYPGIDISTLSDLESYLHSIPGWTESNALAGFGVNKAEHITVLSLNAWLNKHDSFTLKEHEFVVLQWKHDAKID